MAKKIPFVENHKDNMHCVNAVFRMVHQYFFNKDLTWKQIDNLTKAVPGLATWTFVGEMEFAKKGLDVKNIEPISYRQLHKQGVDYISKIVGKKTAEYYFKKSNIAYVLKYIPEYLKTVKHETRRADVKEMCQFLEEGSLIGAEINSRILNNKPGFSLHFILLYDYDGKHITLHDPGKPPIESRKITVEELDKCFNFPGANGAITVFSRK